jgi:tartrate dehydrogenase/decarboxylase/D-malate dehydrogenase
MKTYNIASIEGDGIGKEVVPEAHKVLKKIAEQHQFKLVIDEYDFASCDYYERHGKMLPDNWKEKIEKHDAIFFGAVGMPDRYPDHITLWGSLLKFRREFDQYINLRPVKLFPGINPPLANKNIHQLVAKCMKELKEKLYFKKQLCPELELIECKNLLLNLQKHEKEKN